MKRLKPVFESCMVYGRFDAVAFIQANSLEEIRHIILTQIQSISWDDRDHALFDRRG